MRQYLCPHKSELRIKLILVTSKAMNVDRIKYENCAQSHNFTADINPEESVGKEIVIAESHILPFTVKEPEDAMQMLHDDIEMNMNAGRLYDHHPKKNTKFSYSCAEIFYQRYHEALAKNDKLDESKVWVKTQNIERYYPYHHII